MPNHNTPSYLTVRELIEKLQFERDVMKIIDDTTPTTALAVSVDKGHRRRVVVTTTSEQSHEALLEIIATAENALTQ